MINLKFDNMETQLTPELTKDRIKKLENGKLIYSELNVYKDCFCNHSDYPGKKVEYTKHCPNSKCNRGKIEVPWGKKTRKQNCPDCGGNGWLRLETPIIIGDCPDCKGTLKDLKVSKYDSCYNQNDKELLFTLFDFEAKYSRREQTFNEGYLGLGIIAGITDYGRYLKLSEEDFQKEVKKYFFDRNEQYLHFLNKENEICDKIIIVRTSDGWSAYPIWDNKAKHNSLTIKS